MEWLWMAVLAIFDIILGLMLYDSNAGLGAVLLGVFLVAMGLLWSRKGKGNGKLTLGTSGHLSTFTTDITKRAKEGRLEPVAGREIEMERVVQILMRRTKNNPVLLGEPGVGKTALVEGIAARIVAGNVPSALLGKKILMLDVHAMVSDTKFRGELEGRLRKLLAELEGIASEVILFIDEIHLLAQLSGTEGALGIADILKPALSRGDIRVIGATTLSEYRKYIMPDQAFERRLQPVIVSEPTPEAALDMLRQLRPVYEAYHHVKIPDETLIAAVRLSEEKIDHRFLPDKAIDVMDEAAAKVSIEAERKHLVPLGVVHAASAAASQTVQVSDIESIVNSWAQAHGNL